MIFLTSISLDLAYWWDIFEHFARYWLFLVYYINKSITYQITISNLYYKHSIRTKACLLAISNIVYIQSLLP